MRIARVLLVLPGLAALAWGLILFGQFALPPGPQAFATAAWLIGGPVVHDVIVAPVVAIVALAVVRLSPQAWVAPLLTGAAVSGVLGLVSVPLLWREFGAAPMPGLHDRAVAPGLLVALGVVWALVLMAGIWRSRRATAPGAER
ncbi:hypothetical protein [Prauserella cavernicola]|uniref:Uncharacterized protein n=1 Tax=Prauserella cavernicola TaxID=2800127 RepID=A0A934QVJ8_9PSEU|nr:hypothetical protein [Prauserella cavernicola]MBK1787156.1 hypothetical protein [Prauserella cavernicola]